MRTKKIVITGGPSTGKTSVIEKLETMGYTCLHEVIRSMTLEKKEKEGVVFKSNPIVSVADPMAFNTSILHARVAQYHSAEKITEGVVFLDRGIPDILAYMACFGQEYTSTFTNACTNHPYDHIFLMPPWQDIHVSDTGRFESFEESLEVHQCLLNMYSQLGYEVITVPKLSVIERVNFILDGLKTLR